MDPFKILEEEHRVIEKALDVLEAISERIMSKDLPPSEDLKHIVHFIMMFADKCHHGKEEDKLFPAMERKGVSKVDSPIGILLIEHGIAREYVKGMKKGVEGVLVGNQSGYKLFRVNALEYVKLLKLHIRREDEEVYPLGRSVLNGPDMKRLYREFEEVEEAIGRGTHEDHVRAVEIMHRRYCRRGSE